ncbi:hypothetical protein A2642_00885 [Candidatus Nomurabacteria bacterium RIFCSPHIGHO2_01_FULL_39_10]|uniref:Type I restriction modification DNA specificity domain-containing protein n=1 Tax=Candidatus Nomurabacteria bacterium RIFCSPHIGHO2_01_FULL_39_10 TaxID=1801733 RepID=A0A1F6V474_9BACT|nr:MAG: hypothetical protein A2642_00885 [Candidatus Nomurabacteria bacterium RIFCSPHIGHO2_01_FULL_39_10]
MQLVKLSNLFEAKYGVNLELYSLEENNKRNEDFIPFVSRTENNNGVSAFVKLDLNLKAILPNTLTVAVSGSVLSTFLQPYNYYSGRDLYYLIPKKEMSERELIYYAICITRNKYKYSYGRQANRTLRDLLIPAKIPEKFLNLKINKLNEKSVSNKKLLSNTQNWKWFNLGDLFTFEKGERLTKPDRIEGDVPLITAGENNNGVSEYISLKEFKDKKIIFENKITIDMFFNVFYHNYKYFSDDNIHTLVPKDFKLNQYNSLFLVSILSKLKYKYAYGRQVRLMRLPFEKIKLPIDKNNNPDWQFMEDYIKSLPYSASI